MQPTVLEQIQQWTNIQLKNNIVSSLNRPVILVEESVVSFDKDTGLYYFVNLNKRKEYGLIVTVEKKTYLLLFMHSNLVVPYVKQLLNASLPVEFKLISFENYQYLYQHYSKGNNFFSLDLSKLN